MNKENRNEPLAEVDSDQALAQLLRQAGPRPRPTGDAERQTREAVHAHWQAGLSARRRRRMFSIAAAATVVLALVIAFRPTAVEGPVAEIQVAQLEHTRGEFQMTPALDAPGLHEGQLLQTAIDSPLALRWNSGEAVRVAGGSRLRAVSSTVLALETGAIYLDVAPDHGGSDAPLAIRTARGDIHHLGTQFLVRQESDEVVVAVREGQVTLVMEQTTVPVGHGEQIVVPDGGKPVRSVVPTHGEPWAWVETAATPFELDEVRIDDFLGDVARETGHRLVYADAQAHELARRETFTGRVDQSPRQAAVLVLSTTDLQAHFTDGRLEVQLR